MRAARALTLGSIALSALALAAGYAPDAAPAWYAAIGLVALLWLAAEWQGRGRATGLAFALVVVLAAVGVLLGHRVLWLALAVTAAVTAWLLGGLTRRLAALPHVPDRDARARRFARRLLALDALSLALAAVALQVHVDLTFAVALLLGGLLVYALSRVIGTLRRESA